MVILPKLSSQQNHPGKKTKAAWKNVILPCLAGDFFNLSPFSWRRDPIAQSYGRQFQGPLSQDLSLLNQQSSVFNFIIPFQGPEQVLFQPGNHWDLYLPPKKCKPLPNVANLWVPSALAFEWDRTMEDLQMEGAGKQKQSSVKIHKLTGEGLIYF